LHTGASVLCIWMGSAELLGGGPVTALFHKATIFIHRQHAR